MMEGDILTLKLTASAYGVNATASTDARAGWGVTIYNGEEIDAGYTLGDAELRSKAGGNRAYAGNGYTTTRYLSVEIGKAYNEGDRRSVRFTSCSCETRWIYEWQEVSAASHASDTTPSYPKRSAKSKIEGESLDDGSGGICAYPPETNGYGSAPEILAYTNGNTAAYFNIDFGSGVSSFKISYSASYVDGGTLELHIDSPDGTLIGTVEMPATGENNHDWMKYREASCSISGASGVHDLYLVCRGAYNIDYFIFS